MVLKIKILEFFISPPWYLYPLTHLSLASFLWNIDKQCSTRSDATERNVWSGSSLFVHIKYFLNLNETKTYYQFEIDLPIW